MSDGSTGTAWRRRVERAVADDAPTPAEALLLLRDAAGRTFRPMAPPPGVEPRIGAVLVLLYPDGNDIRLPLTVRSELLSSHRGEVSLPGGRTDPEDDGPVATAVRECWEELGIPPATIQIIGTLPSIYIQPSNFSITPVVGWTDTRPVIHFNDAEVSAILSVTLDELLDPALVVEEDWELRGMPVRVPFFAIGGQKVWGATALMLSDFVARLRKHA